MSMVEEAIGEAAAAPAYALEAADVVAASESDVDVGLSSAKLPQGLDGSARTRSRPSRRRRSGPSRCSSCATR